MTIGTNRQNDADGNATTATYPYTFKVFASTELKVVVREVATGVETELTASQYSVTGVGAATGGNVVLSGTEDWLDGSGYLKSGWHITITRNVSIQQTTDIKNQGDFDQVVHENAFDKLAMIDQQQQVDLDRSLKVPVTFVESVSTELPAPSADMVIGWNADGDALENKADLSAYSISPYSETLLDDANKEAARVTLGMTTDELDFVGAATGYIAVDGDISPTAITAHQDDYSPNSWSTSGVLRISATSRKNITGLVARAAGMTIPVHNVGTFPIDFTYEDASSAAANRFAFTCTLGGGQSMLLQYDDTSSRWRALMIPEPIGTVKDFAGSTLPGGFLAVDQNVSRTTYAALFNEIGTTFGEGDGSTTFGLYIGKGNVLVAAGQGTHTEVFDSASDVDHTTEQFTTPANDDKWITGMAVALSTDGTLPTGLSATTYYVIRVNSTTIKLATTLANAQAGTAVTFSGNGSGNQTITYTKTSRTLGQLFGEEDHAMSATELLNHNHTDRMYLTGTGGSTSANSKFSDSTTGNNGTSSTGGNAAMPNSQPSTVINRGIRFL